MFGFGLRHTRGVSTALPTRRLLAAFRRIYLQCVCRLRGGGSDWGGWFSETLGSVRRRQSDCGRGLGNCFRRSALGMLFSVPVTEIVIESVPSNEVRVT